MTRVGGTMLCVAAHLALGVTVWFLFPFLMGGGTPPEEATPYWWAWDALLVVWFGTTHSALLYPAVRRYLERIVPSPLYGCFFTLVTCLNLIVIVTTWRTSPVVLWQMTGWAALGMNVGYVLSWAGLFYSLSLTGYGWQTGWTPYWAWVRGREVPKRRFEERGAYRILRHPTYLSFLGLVWFTPLVTLDRAVLIGLMTAYIFLGSWLKDNRLVYFLGDVYRRYQARVPGYPLIGLGPLGRVTGAGPVAGSAGPIPPRGESS